MAVTRSAKAKQDEKNSENPEITKEPLKLDVSSKDVSKTDCDINEKSTSSSSRKRSRRSHDEENFPKQKKVSFPTDNLILWFLFQVYTAPRTLRRLSQKQVAAVEDKENNGDVHKETVSCVPSPDDPKIVTAAQGEHVTTVKTPRKGRRGRKSGKSAAPKVAEPAAVNPEEELMVSNVPSKFSSNVLISEAS